MLKHINKIKGEGFRVFKTAYLCKFSKKRNAFGHKSDSIMFALPEKHPAYDDGLHWIAVDQKRIRVHTGDIVVVIGRVHYCFDAKFGWQNRLLGLYGGRMITIPDSVSFLSRNQFEVIEQ